MQLQDMTENQLIRLFNRIRSKYVDMFGVDAVTLALTKPSALDALRDIAKALKEISK